MDQTLLCIGSNCLASICCKYTDYKEIKTPVNNVWAYGGFMRTHKLFNGTFEKEVLSENAEIIRKHYPDATQSIYEYQYVTKSYRFPHTDFGKPNIKDQLRERYNNTMNFINNPKGDYWYLYCLQPRDIVLTEKQIRKQLKKLSKYIDTNRIIVLAGIEHNEEFYKEWPTKKTRFGNQSEAFKKIFGDRYFIIYPANAYPYAGACFVENFERFLKSQH